MGRKNILIFLSFFHRNIILPVGAHENVAGLGSQSSIRHDIAVYSGAGADFRCIHWMRSFFEWWAGPTVVYLDANALGSNSTALRLTDTSHFPNLKLFVVPGGHAEEISKSLGTNGMKNVIEFVESPNGHFLGICAGFYFASGSFWWFGELLEIAEMPHWWNAKIEGPIEEIALFPRYAPATLDNGLTMLYYGGPTVGLLKTKLTTVMGASVLANYVLEGNRSLPAAVLYQTTHVRALLISTHPEAEVGAGIECSPPWPHLCLTPLQQLDNWRFLATGINSLLGLSWKVPESLGINVHQVSALYQ
jgi:hypothetical protein